MSYDDRSLDLVFVLFVEAMEILAGHGEASRLIQVSEIAEDLHL